MEYRSGENEKKSISTCRSHCHDAGRNILSACT